MTLNDLEFKAEDFCGYDNAFVKCPHTFLSGCRGLGLAETANRLLRERLEKAIPELVNRFLAWPLPESVCSDPCATERGYPHRSGTTLLTADEARQMLEHILGFYYRR